METYSLLREFADSWFLLAMFSFFIGVVIYAFWPSEKAAREDAAYIPFKTECDCPNSGQCTAAKIREGALK